MTSNVASSQPPASKHEFKFLLRMLRLSIVSSQHEQVQKDRNWTLTGLCVVSTPKQRQFHFRRFVTQKNLMLGWLLVLNDSKEWIFVEWILMTNFGSGCTFRIMINPKPCFSPPFPHQFRKWVMRDYSNSTTIFRKVVVRGGCYAWAAAAVVSSLAWTRK